MTSTTEPLVNRRLSFEVTPYIVLIIRNSSGFVSAQFIIKGRGGVKVQKHLSQCTKNWYLLTTPTFTLAAAVDTFSSNDLKALESLTSPNFLLTTLPNDENAAVVFWPADDSPVFVLLYLLRENGNLNGWITNENQLSPKQINVIPNFLPTTNLSTNPITLINYWIRWLINHP